MKVVGAVERAGAPQDERRTRVLKFPGSAIRVRGPDAAGLQWLVQFLGPNFWSRTKGESDWTVHLDVDRAAWQRISQRGPARGEPHGACFYQDQTVVELPVWKSGGGSRVLRSPEDDAFLRIDAGTGRVRVVAKEPGRLARLLWMRVVRELAQNRAWTPSSVVLHAAGVTLGKRGVLIAGPKRAGKTSLLLHALSSGSCAYVSNDRSLVYRRAGALRMRGLPTIVKLRASSLEPFPRVLERLRQSSHFPALNREETARRLFGGHRPWKPGTHTLSPWQLTELLGGRRRAESGLAAVLFPAISGRDGRIKIERLGPKEAHGVLDGAVFRAGRPDKAGGELWDFRRGAPPGSDDVDAFLGAIAADTPCFRVILGLDAYSRGTWIDRLDRILDAG